MLKESKKRFEIKIPKNAIDSFSIILTKFQA